MTQTNGETTSMTAATNATPPPDREIAEITQTDVHQLLTREQYFALARLERLLERRDAVDAERLAARPEHQQWLVRALDAAIVSYYRLAGAVGVGTEADLLLRGYRHLGVDLSPTINRQRRKWTGERGETTCSGGMAPGSLVPGSFSRS
jgi:hypothetical protein